MANFVRLSHAIKEWGLSLGFQQVGITQTDLAEDEAYLLDWLAKGMQGEMQYMARHGSKRSRPAELLAGTISVISVRMNYLPDGAYHPQAVLDDPQLAYISRYALGRDYHKLIRQRLKQLCRQIEQAHGSFAYRCFTDSAPVLEKALARNGGLGWIGKHSNLINRQTGSWFFLGEIYTDLPLQADPVDGGEYCGTCVACLEVCPTQAIIGPKQVDARRCISYLTIELSGSIPVEFRKKMGNRIYGCDDCQLVCPWNRFARPTVEKDFRVRHGLDKVSLRTLFEWDEASFLRNTEGSAIRRIGYQRWQRNIAVALGNASQGDAGLIAALQARLATASDLVAEHIIWALQQHGVR